MCGRFVSATPPDQLARYFGAELLIEPWPGDPTGSGANYNVAPSQRVHTVYEDARGRCLADFHWGLIPFWAKDARIGAKMINARAETVAEKNSFKRPFAKRRCIIPADGFYEWKKLPDQKRKQPVYVTTIDGSPFAFAGLWEVWSDGGDLDEQGEPRRLHSCTIITGPPNEKVATVHDRMPVMLPPAAWDGWLDRGNEDVEALQRLLVPAPAQLVSMRPVSTEVNNVRNNGPHLLDEAEPVSQG